MSNSYLFYTYQGSWNNDIPDYSRNFPNSVIFHPETNRIIQNGIIYDGQGSGLIYIEGNLEDTQGVWTGSSNNIDSYYDGLTIVYVPKVSGGSSSTTLNINNLGAKTCQLNLTNLTNEYSAEQPLLFVYRNNSWHISDYVPETIKSSVNNNKQFYLVGATAANGQLYFDSNIYTTTNPGHLVVGSVSVGTNTKSANANIYAIGSAILNNGTVTSDGFIKNISNVSAANRDNYILLAGGGHRSIFDFVTTDHTHDRLDIHNINDNLQEWLPNNLTYYPEKNLITFMHTAGMPTFDWYSGLNIKGNTNEFSSWQLVGKTAKPTAGNPEINDHLYLRYGRGTTWQAWKTIIDSDNIHDYIDALGIVTTMTGATNKIAYYETPTQISAAAGTIGSTGVPIWMDNGELKPIVGASLFTVFSSSGPTTTITIAGETKSTIINYSATSGTAQITDRALNADRLSTVDGTSISPINAGTTIQPVYFTNGVPEAISGQFGSTVKGIYYDNGIKTMTYELHATVNGATTGTMNQLAYYEDPTHISVITGSYGASNKPIWINNGQISSIGGTAIGASNHPVWINEQGEIVPISSPIIGKVSDGTTGKLAVYKDKNDIESYTASIGAIDNPVYFFEGLPQRSTATIGNTNKPIYISGGTLQAISYELNANIKLAPTGIINKVAYYEDPQNISAASGTIGSTSVPIWMNNGSLQAVNPAEMFSVFGASGPTIYITVAGVSRTINVEYAETSSHSSSSQTAEEAERLTASAGSSIQPVYFDDGLPVGITGQFGSTNRGIYYDDGFKEMDHQLNATLNGGASGTMNQLAHYENATTVSPVSGTFGATNKPIWISGGKISTIGGGTAIGASNHPVWVNAQGEIVPISEPIIGKVSDGTTGKLAVYKDKNDIESYTANVGAIDNPVYFLDGLPQRSTATIGANNRPIYISGGTLQVISYELNANVKGTTASIINHVAYYEDPQNISPASGSIGEVGIPIWMDNGMLKPIIGASLFTVFSSSGQNTTITIAGETKTTVINYSATSGTAQIANRALNADRLSTVDGTSISPINAGTTIQPVYFTDGVPEAISGQFGSTVKGIYYDNGIKTMTYELKATLNGGATDTMNQLAHYENATTVSPITGTYGASNQPIWISGGKISTIGGGTAIGASNQPVWINAEGEIVPVTGTMNGGITAGSTGSIAMYTSGNEIGNYTATVGNTIRPIYFKDGLPTLLSGDVGTATKSIYLSNGEFKESIYILAANINAGNSTNNQLAHYEDSNNIKAVTGSYGSTSIPIFINNGVPQSVEPSEMFSSFSSTGNTTQITIAGHTKSVVINYSATSGTALVANTALEVEKLTSSAGSSIQPIYFSDGRPVGITGQFGSAVKGIYYDNGIKTMTYELNATLNGGPTSTLNQLAHYENATTVSPITGTYGASNKPIWISGGKISTIGGGTAIGASNQPVWINAEGEIVPVTGTMNGGITAGSTGSIAMYTSDNEIGVYDKSIGAIDNPVYFLDGVPQRSTATVGANNKPIYISGGTLTVINYELNANVNGTTASIINHVAYYEDSTHISPASGSIGEVGIPIWMDNGMLKPIVGASLFSVFSSSGPTTTITIAGETKSTVINYSATSGTAQVATNALTAEKLTSSAGTSIQPIYFNDGRPVGITGQFGSAVKGIYYDNGIKTMTYDLNATLNGGASGTMNQLAHYENATTVSPITGTYGAWNKPIWINGGKISSIGGTAIGASNQPVWVNSQGEIVPVTGTMNGSISNGTIGSLAMYTSINGIGVYDKSIGAIDNPVYFLNGVPQRSTATIGANNKPIYISGGTLQAIGYELNANVNGTTASIINHVAYYEDSTHISPATGTIGSTGVPIWMDNGALKAIEADKMFTVFSSSGPTTTITIAGETKSTVINYSTTSGTALVADRALEAEKLTSSAGTSIQPIYFSNGRPVGITGQFGSAVKGIYYDNGIKSMTYELNATLNSGASGTMNQLAHYENATTVSPITGTYGAWNQPVWINGGKISTIGGTAIGASNQPVWVNSQGEIVPVTGTMNGSITTGSTGSIAMYTSDNEIGVYDKSIGAIDNPVYFLNGVPQHSTATVGANNKPIYISGGTLTTINYELNANVNGTTASIINHVAYYEDSTHISPASGSIGEVGIPIWMDNGMLKPIVGASLFTVFSSSGQNTTITIAGETKSTIINYSATSGTALIADRALNADRLSIVDGTSISPINAGTTIQPVYFNDGRPVGITGQFGSVVKGIYYDNGIKTMTYELKATLNGGASGTMNQLAHYENATTVSPVSGTYGATNKPIWINGGKISSIGTSLGIGASNHPVWVNAQGEIVPISSPIIGKVSDGTTGKLAVYKDKNDIESYTASIGAIDNPVYFFEGLPQRSTATVGANNKPIYISGGTLQVISYELNATLNGGATDTMNQLAHYENATTVSPITGTYGAANKPIWINGGKISSIGTSLGIGASNHPVWVNTEGEIVPISGAIVGKVSSGITGKLAIYVEENDISSYTASVGAIDNPVYFFEGLPQRSTATIGANNKPIYIAGGTLTTINYELNANVGAATGSIVNRVAYYEDSTHISPASGPIGSAGVPIWMDNGALKAVTPNVMFSDFSSGTTTTTITIAGETKSTVINYSATSGTAHVATTALTAEKLTSSAGTSIQPIYISDGCPVGITGQFGSAVKGIYYDNGIKTMTYELNATVKHGSTDSTVINQVAYYENGGQISAASGPVGTAGMPIWMDNGVLKPITGTELFSAFSSAGTTGTYITIAGTSRNLEIQYATRSGSASSASKLDSINAGDTAHAVYFSNGLPVALSGSTGSSVRGIYLKDGEFTMMTHSLNATVLGNTTINRLVHYSSATAIGPVTGNIGSDIRPIYINSGVPTALGASVGTAAIPIYLDGGVIKAVTGTAMFSGFTADGNNTKITIAGASRTLQIPYATNAGSANKLSNTNAGGSLQAVYFNDGIPVGITSNLGGSSKPIYLDNGIFTECNKFSEYGSGGEVIIGTQSTGATTNLWTGVSKLETAADLKPGYHFNYWLPVAGNGSNATLTLTFKDGSTKTIDLYYQNNTRITTHFTERTNIDFIYLENPPGVPVTGTTLTGAWAVKGYDSNNYDRILSNFERRRLNSSDEKLYCYKLVGYSSNGKIVPITITKQDTTEIANKTKTSTSIDATRGLMYYGTTTKIENTTTNIGSLYNEIPFDLRYTFNTVGPSALFETYLCGSYDYNTQLFTLDDSATNSWYVYRDLTSNTNPFVEGKFYMYVGPSLSTYQVQLKYNNTLYYYDGTKLLEVGKTPFIDKSKTISVSLKPTTSWVNIPGFEFNGSVFEDGDGAYIINVTENNCKYSGIMSVTTATTNSTSEDDSDEIILHRIGKTTNHRIYLRTMPNGSRYNLQISSDDTFSANVNFVFSFRKLV